VLDFRHDHHGLLGPETTLNLNDKLDFVMVAAGVRPDV
jgi:hypothetical protein